ncbi:PAS domain S-box protein [Aquabacterium sp. J223]|uniref:sensor histidine kinase n=1 Tax=Aquabacterium sp. J223 TaxID=2898431 RepID=UPI0021AE0FEC|nr:PAS domain S-box protein [Aquabacterium sp. J223]UUX97149.1 PAS domain S-box protein [Aquabacterium sp. J223]
MRPALLTLRWRLALLPGLLALVFALIGLTAAEWALRRQAVADAEALSQRSARALAALVERALDRRVADMEVLADQLGRQPLADAADLRARVEAVALRIEGYAWIGVTDAEGRVLAATGGILQGQSIAGRPVYLRGRESVFVGDLHPAVALARYLPPGDGGPPVLADIGVPVRDAQGRLAGVVTAHLLWDWFQRLRDEVQGDLGAERTLHATVRSPTGRQLPGGPGVPWPALTAGVATAVRPGEPTLQRVRAEGGHDWLVAVRTLSPRTAASTLGWQVLVAHDLDAVAAGTRRTLRPLLGWTVVSVAAFALLGLLLSRRLSQPYQVALERAAERLGRGKRSAMGEAALLDALVQQFDGLDADARPGAALTGQDVLTRLVRDADRLQQLVESLPSPVFVLGEDAEVLYWNPACEAAFGWTAAQVEGKGLQTLLPGAHAGGGPEWGARVAAARHREQPLDFELEVQARDGRRVTAEWRLAPLRGRDGRARNVLGQARDVTERVRAEQAQQRHREELSALARRLMDQDTLTTRRLAQALHDQLGQTLAALRLSWEALERARPPQADDRTAELARHIGGLIEHAVGEVRQVLTELRPPLLEEQGLLAALENEFYRGPVATRPGSVDVLVEADTALDGHRWPAPVEQSVFMIAREAVANALRHAQASLVRVVLNGDAQGLQLEVVDDGMGVPLSGDGAPPVRPGHLGMVGMRERAAAIGGRFEVRHAIGGGTIVRVSWHEEGST